MSNKNTKEYRIKLRVSFLTVCLMLLAGCGGSGGGTSGPGTMEPDTSDPPGAITTQGVITAFGSVYVNGVEYETDSATIESDDSTATESDLKIGQVVTLKGSVNEDGSTGEATSIEYNDKVEGPIASINGNTLVVLGQAIIVDDGTVFDDETGIQSIADLNPDDVIEVSGFTNSNGEIVATYLELNDPGGEYELVGIVSNLDSNGSTFDIGDQGIEFSGAVLEDFDGALIADGDKVEAKGSTFDLNGDLVAIKVELEEDELAEDDEFEVEGLISQFESDASFVVSETAITTNSSTVYEGGTVQDLALDVKVEVEGQIGAESVLLAAKVKFKHVEDTRFEAVVDSVNADANQVTVLGITFAVTKTTQLEDDSELEVYLFGLDDVAEGDYLEIRGKLETDGSVASTRVERDDPDDESSVRGAVQSNDGSSLVIAGVTILTNGTTEYRDASEMAMTQADFFTAAAVGIEVKAKGDETDTSEITAKRLELEGDD